MAFLRARDGERVATLSIDSLSDPNAESGDFNPANFQINIPNTIKLQCVSGVCYNLVSIPRMFPTIGPYNNTLIFWQRPNISIPISGMGPNMWLKTVGDWEPVLTLTLPTGQWNINDILSFINTGLASFFGATNIWSYDSNLRTISIEFDGNYETYGIRNSVGPPPFVHQYMTLCYVTDGDSELFDTLGLQGPAQIASAAESRNMNFSLYNSTTFDAVVGSSLEGIVALPLFDPSLHDILAWSQVWHSPRYNPPNISGPTIVKVILQDLGDNSQIDAKTGVTWDVITTVDLTDVDFGFNSVKEIRDGVSEGILFSSSRHVTAFKVKLLDRKFRQLVLPRNFPVHIVLQVMYTDR